MLHGFVGLALSAAAPALATGPFDWLVGHWCEQTARARTCERWTPFTADRMEGSGTTVRRGKIVEREVTTIHLTTFGATYDATPAGAATVRFTEIERGPRSVSFENRAHDYPQRIRYWREGADLLAEISLTHGGRLMRWRYRRVN